jgi:hypothetical protein
MSFAELIVLPAILVLASCVQSPKADQQVSCSAGSVCKVTGKLEVFRGVPHSVAVIETDSGRFALALREDLYPRIGSGAYTATVRGTASMQMRADSVISCQLKDRWVALGGCDQCLILYVDELHIPKIALNVSGRRAS